jgi:hypothetical protein
MIQMAAGIHHLKPRKEKGQKTNRKKQGEIDRKPRGMGWWDGMGWE